VGHRDSRLGLAQDADVLLTDEPTPPRPELGAASATSHGYIAQPIVGTGLSAETRILLVPRFGYSPRSKCTGGGAQRYYSHPDAGAVGMHLYMSSVGREHPSKAMLGGNAMVFRPVTETELHGSQKVDVLMGSILMTPQAYHVEYEYTPRRGRRVGSGLRPSRRPVPVGR